MSAAAEPTSMADAAAHYLNCKGCKMPIAQNHLLCPDWNCRAALFLHQKCGTDAYNAGNRIICHACHKAYYAPVSPHEKLKRFFFALFLMISLPQLFGYFYDRETFDRTDFIQRCIIGIFISFVVIIGVFILVLVVELTIIMAEKIWLRVTRDRGQEISIIK